MPLAVLGLALGLPSIAILSVMLVRASGLALPGVLLGVLLAMLPAIWCAARWVVGCAAGRIPILRIPVLLHNYACQLRASLEGS